MKQVLRALGLIRQFTTTLTCTKAVFLHALKHNIDDPDFEPFERYRSGSPFKGTVSGEEFELRRRRNFWTQKMDEVNLNGVVTEDSGKAIIQVEAEAVHGYFIPLFVVFFAFTLVAAFFSDNNVWIAAVVSFVFMAANAWMMQR